MDEKNSDKKDLKHFIPKDTKKSKGILKQEQATRGRYASYHHEEASDGTVDKFISEQYDRRNAVWYRHNQYTKRWDDNVKLLKRGKPIMWKGKLRNPPKLDLTNYLKSKQEQEDK